MVFACGEADRGGLSADLGLCSGRGPPAAPNAAHGPPSLCGTAAAGGWDLGVSTMQSPPGPAASLPFPPPSLHRPLLPWRAPVGLGAAGPP